MAKQAELQQLQAACLGRTSANVWHAWESFTLSLPVEMLIQILTFKFSWLWPNYLQLANCRHSEKPVKWVMLKSRDTMKYGMGILGNSTLVCQTCRMLKTFDLMLRIFMSRVFYCNPPCGNDAPWRKELLQTHKKTSLLSGWADRVGFPSHRQKDIGLNLHPQKQLQKRW